MADNAIPDNDEEINSFRSLCCKKELVRKGRADYRCAGCGQDSTMELLFFIEAVTKANKMSCTKTKSLKINGIVYAKYEIEEIERGNTLYLKVIKELAHDRAVTEDLLSAVIAGVEEKIITSVAHLNI